MTGARDEIMINVTKSTARALLRDFLIAVVHRYISTLLRRLGLKCKFPEPDSRRRHGFAVSTVRNSSSQRVTVSL